MYIVAKCWVEKILSKSPTGSLTHSLTHSSLIHSLTHSLIHPLNHSLTRSLTHSLFTAALTETETCLFPSDNSLPVAEVQVDHTPQGTVPASGYLNKT